MENRNLLLVYLNCDLHPNHLVELLDTSDFSQCFTEKGNNVKNLVLGLNKQLNNSKTCKIAVLLILQTVIKQCPTAVLNENSLLWLNCLTNISQQNISENVQSVSYEIILELLVFVVDNSELSRQFLTSHFPKLLPALLAANENTCSNSLKCLRYCMERFRGPCRQLKIEIEQYLIGLFTSNNTDIANAVASCYIMLPGLGGGGERGVLHKKAWEEFMQKLVGTLTSLLVELLKKMDLFDDSEKSHSELELPEIDEVLPVHRVVKICMRLNMLATCFHRMMKSPSLSNVQVPISSIIRFVSMALTPTPKQLDQIKQKITIEDTVIASKLPLVHKIGLDMLYTLVECNCHQSAFINQRMTKLLLHVLEWTKVQRDGDRARFSELRKRVYEIIYLWTTCRTATYGLDKLYPRLLSHLEADASIVTNETSIVPNKVTSGKKKNKKRKLSHDIIEAGIVTSKHQRYPEANEELCIAALRAMKSLVRAFGRCFNEAIYRRLYSFLLLLTRRTGSKIPPEPYKNADCRDELNSTFLAMVLIPSTFQLPDIPKRIFQRGLNCDNLNVKNTCIHALSVCSALMKPQMVAIQPQPLDVNSLITSRQLSANDDVMDAAELNVSSNAEIINELEGESCSKRPRIVLSPEAIDHSSTAQELNGSSMEVNDNIEHSSQPTETTIIEKESITSKSLDVDEIIIRNESVEHEATEIEENNVDSSQHQLHPIVTDDTETVAIPKLSNGVDDTKETGDVELIQELPASKILEPLEAELQQSDKICEEEEEMMAVLNSFVDADPDIM